MHKVIKKFSSQANAEVLAAMQDLAQKEGKHFSSLLEEAMEEYLASKASSKPRPKIIQAMNASMHHLDGLLKRLADS